MNTLYKSIKLLFVFATLGLSSQLYSQVGINTDDPKATLHVEGDMIVSPLPFLSSSDALVVDDEGKIGKAVHVPSRVLFTQSINLQPIARGSAEATAFNTFTPFLITWNQGTDIVSNNCTLFEGVNSTGDFENFVISESGLYEISGYINYDPGNIKNVGYTSLQLTIQHFKPSVGQWMDISSNISMWERNSNNYRKTVSYTPVVIELESGDKIRATFSRPNNNLKGSSHFGANDGGLLRSGGGVAYSKSIKILKL